ncbi:hypothetical protein GCM10022200_05000 [Microbacterium awajiense]|uniref:DUF5671 domain-containing protein n=2 Tax=Microbacterium awajiense TaxID=415214 RepID=A0ABP7A661_9MICO
MRGREEAIASVEPAPGQGFEKWMGFLSGFVAPLTVVTALLFYFGYVSTREFFLYFGIDVDLIGLGSQEFVMRSPGALFIPVMVLLLLSAGLLVGHRMLRRRLVEEPVAVAGRVVATIAWSGIGLVLGGLLVAFLGPVLADGGVAQLITPVLLAVGAGLCAYAASTARARGASLSRTVVVLLVLVMVAGTFWATATVAQWWGRGQARAVASDFTVLPAVVLDTRERLAPGNDAITFHELDVPDADGGATYGFRYFGLRLLAQGDGRLYLVPDRWSPNASTIVVPYDDVRVRFRFVPDADPPSGSRR